MVDTSHSRGPNADAQAVADASERLRLLMIDPDASGLDALLADDLSYGHSNGKLDTKASLMADLQSGASDFVTIALTEQVVHVAGDTALVRHTLVADTNDGGKPGHVKLKVLLVWQRRAGAWKLLARQAVRLPA
jgi:Domain of unknown function (DUF4440)